MGKKLFGTDGVRGRVNTYPMTADLVLRLGLAAGAFFRKKNKHTHRVVIGKDTRLSGYIFETALTAGLCASGMDVFQVGVLPTPAVAFLANNMRADFGIVISASHNPFYDNGIKFFSADGYKLPDAVEEAIEAKVLEPECKFDLPAPERVGRAFRIKDSPGRYIVHLKNTFPHDVQLEGIRIVLDCANGASYAVGPLTFEELGADVVKIANTPNGLNINEGCGALHPALAADKVRETRADIGVALDGDADRLIVVDEKGQILDGDQIMAICALDAMEKGLLPGNLLVGTVMSNMALEVFMRERGGRLLRTPVGDRHVVEAMRANGALMGGEQSGHLVFMKHGTTGDGLMAALQLLKIMKERQKPLSELAGLLQIYPQELINVPVKQKIPFEEVESIMEAVRAAEKELGTRGRVLLRYSGTESKARVMVEGENPQQVKRLAEDLAIAVETGLKTYVGGCA